MKHAIERVLDEFHETRLPELTTRVTRVVELPGKAAVVIGMRRAGKTWFCYQRMKELMAAGHARDAVLYVNFEDERLLPFGTGDFQVLLDTFFARNPSVADRPHYFFFDEIQRIPGWEMFVRRQLDSDPGARIWLTGSSSKLLSSEIATALRGRSLATEIFPFSFPEFLSFHGVDTGAENVFGPRKRAALLHHAGRYLATGGFPEAQRADNETRRRMLQQYVDVVVLRDVIERHGVSNAAVIRELTRTLLAAPGGLFSVNRFYNTLKTRGMKCDKNELYCHMDHLSDAFLVHPVSIHSRSHRVRMVNPRKIYANDTGLVQAMSFGMTDDKGLLLENMVFLHLRRNGVMPDYCVTGSGREVDFVYHATEGRRLLQVCWSLNGASVREREIRALREAMDETHTRQATIVTWNEENSLDGIRVVPAWKFLLQPM